MKYKVILTDSAFFDLKQIESYISKDNPSIAKEYVAKIFEKFKNLESFPNIGHQIENNVFSHANFLYLICMNHITFYQINEIAKCVYIVRVLSHYENWKYIINKEIFLVNIELISDEVISIRQMNKSMYYDVWKNSLDENNRKFVPDEVFESLEEASEVVDFIINSYSSEDGPFIYAVIRKSDNTNLGYVQLIKIEEGWEIGYHIAKRYNGNGYATRSVKLFLDYLKKQKKIKEIYGIALKSNKASIRVLEKNGFEIFYDDVGMYQGSKRKIIKSVKKL